MLLLSVWFSVSMLSSPVCSSRYLEVNPDKLVICHCTDCQVLSGCPYRIAIFSTNVTIINGGKPKNYIKTSEAGSKRAQAFCPNCGTHLWATSVGDVGLKGFGIRAGTIVQRNDLKPFKQIWCRSKLGFVDNLEASVPECSEMQ